MNDDLIYEHLYFIIKTSIKLGGFFYCFIFFYDTFIKSFLPSSFFFGRGGRGCANYCVIVTANFSPCCGWLQFAAQPKLLFFSLAIQTFVLP